MSATVRAHEDAVLSLCWLDGDRLVTGSVDEAVTVWRYKKDGEKSSLSAVKSHASAHILGVTSLSAETGGYRASTPHVPH